MKSLFFAAVLAAQAVAAQDASKPQLGASLIQTAAVARERTKMDPLGLTGYPTLESVTALLLNGSYLDTTFTYRIDHDQQVGAFDGADHASVTQTWRSSLLSLKKSFAIGDHASLVMGKMNIGLDDAHYAHVLDFLEDNLISADFEDYAGRVKGFPLIEGLYSRDRFTGQLIYSDDSATNTNYIFNSQNPGYNRGIRQWLAVGRWRWEDWSVLSVVQKPENMKAGAGFSLIQTVNEHLQWYGAAFDQKGSRLPVLQEVYPNGNTPFRISDFFSNHLPFQMSRLSEDRHYLRGMLGVGWVGEDQTGLRLEWLHDPRGMSPSEFRRWREFVAYSKAQRIDVFQGIGLADADSALRVRQQDSVLLRADRPLGQHFTAAVNIVVGLDGSSAWQWRLHYASSPSWETWTDVSHTLGRGGTEFGSALQAARLSMGVRCYF